MPQFFQTEADARRVLGYDSAETMAYEAQRDCEQAALVAYDEAVEALIVGNKAVALPSLMELAVAVAAEYGITVERLDQLLEARMDAWVALAVREP